MIAIVVGTRQGECEVSKMLADTDDVPVKEKQDVVLVEDGTNTVLAGVLPVSYVRGY